MANNYQQFACVWRGIDPAVANEFEKIVSLTCECQDWDLDDPDTWGDRDEQDLLCDIFGQKWMQELEWGLDCEVSVEKDDAGARWVWIFTDESGSLGHVVEIICYLQSIYGPELAPPFQGSWAAFCSKARLDEFSGGAVVCFEGQAYWNEAQDWSKQKLKELQDRKMGSE